VPDAPATSRLGKGLSGGGTLRRGTKPPRPNVSCGTNPPIAMLEFTAAPSWHGFLTHGSRYAATFDRYAGRISKSAATDGARVEQSMSFPQQSRAVPARSARGRAGSELGRTAAMSWKPMPRRSGPLRRTPALTTPANLTATYGRDAPATGGAAGHAPTRRATPPARSITRRFALTAVR
jgi:hypothetical protein